MIGCPILALPLSHLSSMPNYRISTSIQTLRPPYRHLSWTTRTHNVDHRASSKLFADAEREEAAEQTGTPPPRAAILPRAAPEHPNWMGDERMEDAVLRMLVDKYKPLRTGSMQTSEDKIRRVPPLAMSAQPSTPTPTPISETPSSVPSLPSPSPSRHPRVYRANEPLLPAVEGHKPWLTTFKAPSHPDAASIRYGQFPALRSGSSSSGSSSRAVAQSGAVDDDRARRQRREAKKRSEVAGRLTRAKESTLDYRLGIIKGAKGGGAQAQVQVQVRQNPVSMKGWAGLVEERIEVRRIHENSSQFPYLSLPPPTLSFSHHSTPDWRATSALSKAAGSPSKEATRSTTRSSRARSFS